MSEPVNPRLLFGFIQELLKKARIGQEPKKTLNQGCLKSPDGHKFNWMKAWLYSFTLITSPVFPTILNGRHYQIVRFPLGQQGITRRINIMN